MPPISYARHQFPAAIIQHAVWLYVRFTLSYRDVEDLLAERGLEVSYETVRRWVLKFGPAMARRLLDLLRKSGEFPMMQEDLHAAAETIYERV
jgi:putative transposase